MTYISRGTRIIVPRWLDECDAEYELRACRKRSDGRLKRHASCDDLRAWVSNNCLNHEYLVDLMSDGESTGKSHVRLYGRYIPVPVLLKLYQELKQVDVGTDGSKENANANANTNRNAIVNTNTKSNTNTNATVNAITNTSSRGGQKMEKNNDVIGWKGGVGTDGQSFNRGSNVNGTSSNTNGEYDFQYEGEENLWKAQCEKYLLEKKFFECRSLLCKAVGKLEKIDSIICKAHEESDNARNEEIESAFLSARSVCICSASNSPSACNSPSGRSFKEMREAEKLSEVLRKISDLKQKLKAIRDKRQNLNEQIRMQMRESSCNGAKHQVTELYNRNNEVKSTRLNKKLEKLMSEKGELLQELTEALKSLKVLKKSAADSRSRVSLNSRASYPKDEEFQCRSPIPCACGCQCTDNLDSSASHLSYTSREEFSVDAKQTEMDYMYSPGVADNLEENYDRTNRVSGNSYNEEVFQSRTLQDSAKTNTRNYKSSFSQSNSLVTPNMSSGPTPIIATPDESKVDNVKVKKKSKLKFICPDKPCKKKSWSEDFENFEIYDNSKDVHNFQQTQQQPRRQEQLENKNAWWEQQQQQQQQQSKRQEQLENKNAWRQQQQQQQQKQSALTDENIRQRQQEWNGPVANGTTTRPYTSPSNKQRSWDSEIPERKIKSETAMEEIEKALRNYEQRLRSLDCLEHKIVKMQQRLSEENRQKEEWLKQTAERKKLRAEREKTNKEMTKLCSENLALRKRVRELLAKSDVQMKKIECLKTSKKKLEESEYEAEELKKELCEFQNGFEEQKKCISMLEDRVHSQNTEICKLKKLIKQLSIDNNSQKSRSFSLESVKMTPANVGRQNFQRCGKFNHQSSEDEGWNFEDWHQQEVINQQRLTGCYPPQAVRRTGRRVN